MTYNKCLKKSRLSSDYSESAVLDISGYDMVSKKVPLSVSKNFVIEKVSVSVSKNSGIEKVSDSVSKQKNIEKYPNQFQQIFGITNIGILKSFWL